MIGDVGAFCLSHVFCVSLCLNQIREAEIRVEQKLTVTTHHVCHSFDARRVPELPEIISTSETRESAKCLLVVFWRAVCTTFLLANICKFDVKSIKERSD
jgi:hypothetical protein